MTRRYMNEGGVSAVRNARRSPLAPLLLGLLAGLLLLARPCPAEETSPDLEDRPRAGASAPSLLIQNPGPGELVSVRFTQGQAVSLSRLDLAPGSDEELENPGGVCDVRMDLGLSLASWQGIDLEHTSGLSPCPTHRDCLAVTDLDGKTRHVAGASRQLLPRPGDTPACMLERFRPGMTMRDACGLVNTERVADDNAVLATLGYAGLVWSARLYAGSGSESDITREELEDVELRQVLNGGNVSKVRRTLASQGYIVWQASFPGIDINFPDMAGIPDMEREHMLAQIMDTFLKSGRGDASVMFAPSNMLPELVTADSPRRDVQVFTLIMRRDSGTLILDMANYGGEEMHD